MRTLFDAAWHLDLFKLAIMCVTMCVLWTSKRVPEPVIVLAAAIVGLVVHPFLHG
jgi:chromate transporter